MRTDMPDKDITLGEVYRAVLSLKEEFIETRKDISESHNALREDLKAQGLKLKELEVKNRGLEDQNKSTIALNQALADRVRSLELVEPGKGSDPWARIGAAASGLGGLVYWWLHGAGGGGN
jgi:hypothetical protein